MALRGGEDVFLSLSLSRLGVLTTDPRAVPMKVTLIVFELRLPHPLISRYSEMMGRLRSISILNGDVESDFIVADMI